MRDYDYDIRKAREEIQRVRERAHAYVAQARARAQVQMQQMKAHIRQVQQQAQVQMRQLIQKHKEQQTPASELDQILQAFLKQHHYDFVEFWHPENKTRVVRYLDYWIAEIRYKKDLRLAVIAEHDHTKQYKINLYDPESFNHLLTALREIWLSMPESKRRIRNVAFFVVRVLFDKHFLRLPVFAWIALFAILISLLGSLLRTLS